jgi:hypothetical protein
MWYDKEKSDNSKKEVDDEEIANVKAQEEAAMMNALGQTGLINPLAME